jgi:hypothetical protein
MKLKNVEKKGAHHFSNKPDALVPSQEDLRELLGMIWNNQDNLTKEDIKTLEHLSKK